MRHECLRHAITLGQSADRAGRAYRQRRRAAGAGTPVQLNAPVSLTPTLSHREREPPKKCYFRGLPGGAALAGPTNSRITV